MLNAYMSMLEHTLAISLPFVGFNPAAESLTDFIGKRWGDRYVRVFGKKDPQAPRHREALVRLTDTWRNSYSHGNFDKQHGAILFHTPGVGAIPAAFSDVRDSPHFQFIPAESGDFDDAMAKLDAIDAWPESGPIAEAMLWTLAGLDVQFRPGIPGRTGSRNPSREAGRTDRFSRPPVGTRCKHGLVKKPGTDHRPLTKAWQCLLGVDDQRRRFSRGNRECASDLRASRTPTLSEWRRA